MGIAKTKNGLCFLWITLIILGLDILTKGMLIRHFRLHETQGIFPGLSLTYVRNYGAAFGLFFGHRWPLAGFAALISIVIMRILYRTPRSEIDQNTAFSLILGGALGNLFDRLYHGYVIDFLDFYLKDWHYPAFNLADSAICIGAFLLLISCFSHSKTISNKRDSYENHSG